MQITDIEYVLGKNKESIEDLGRINPDWIIEKLKDSYELDVEEMTLDKENVTFRIPSSLR